MALNISTKYLGMMIPLLGALYGVGCGGSAFSDSGSGGTGSVAGSGGTGSVAGSGGAVGHGGCPGLCNSRACGANERAVGDACCPSCEPIGGAGGIANGGSGGNQCAAALCAGILCPSGSKAEIAPGQCCPSCVPDGSGGTGGACTASCPAYDCATGYHLAQAPGDCCATCVSDDACMAGQDGYQTLENELLAPTAVHACKVDQDCSLLYGNAYCGQTCSALPVNAAQATAINSKLESYAKANCSTCKPEYPPCAAPFPAQCINSQCVSGIPQAGI